MEMSGKDTLPPPKVDSRLDGYEGPASSFEKLVDSRLFITFARVMMILATLIGLPIAGVIGTRALTTMDKSLEKLDLLNTNHKVLTEQVKNGFDRSNETMRRIEVDVADHESRIRLLERLPPAVLVPQPPELNNTRPQRGR